MMDMMTSDERKAFIENVSSKIFNKLLYQRAINRDEKKYEANIFLRAFKSKYSIGVLERNIDYQIVMLDCFTSRNGMKIIDYWYDSIDVRERVIELFIDFLSVNGKTLVDDDVYEKFEAKSEAARIARNTRKQALMLSRKHGLTCTYPNRRSL